ncbi:unnamed protein product [marine sediment metagenome]|uniref:Uncharacterized protein n=1 Tax=marine sediment metagenome TaxID=412755 RepID=X0WGR6_9ZZZZ
MRTFLGAAAAVSLCWVLVPGVVMAQAAEPGAHDPVTVDVWQAGFTIAVFLILVLILSGTAFKPILAGLEKRESFIRESLASAQRDREAAEARLKEYEQKLEQARAEAAALLEEGRENVEAMRRRIEEEARRSGEAILDRAKQEIGNARDTALKAVYEESAGVAASLAGTVLKRQLSPEEHQRLMLDALRELGQRPGMSN